MRELLQHKTIPTNGIQLHVVQAGPADGKPVFLLHGWPEFWYEWRHQIQPLTEAGYRLWIPDQRGYNTSDKPPAIKDYQVDLLVQDILGLMDQTRQEKCLLVGHDWGGMIAWRIAMQYPERLEKLVIINLPHPKAFQRELRQSWKQKWKSAYVGTFQIPKFPEWYLGLQNWRRLVATLRRSSIPGAFTNEDMQKYREAWSQPGAMTAMLNWYRAYWQHPPKRPPDLRVHVPTLIIWGKKDHVLRWQMAQPSADMCDDARLVYIDEATHWVPADVPDQVNRLLLEFFGS